MDLDVTQLIKHLIKSYRIANPGTLLRSGLAYQANALHILRLQSQEVFRLLEIVKPINSWFLDKTFWPLEQHLGRIKYLIQNPTVDPIKIDICGISGGLKIVDGQHRLLAAYLTKQMTISGIYVGRPELASRLLDSLKD